MAAVSWNHERLTFCIPPGSPQYASLFLSDDPRVASVQLDDLRAELAAVKAERDRLRERMAQIIRDSHWSPNRVSYTYSWDIAAELADARRWAAAWKAAAKRERDDRIEWSNSESTVTDALRSCSNRCDAMRLKMRKWRKRAKKAEQALLKQEAVKP